MRLLTIIEIAARLGVRWPTIMEWVSRGICPSPHVVGDLARFSEAEFDAWAAAGCPEQAPPTAGEFVAIESALSAEDVAEADRLDALRAERQEMIRRNYGGWLLQEGIER